MKYFEDFKSGDLYRFGSYLMTESEMIQFSSQYDPQLFHTDPQRASESPLGHFCASGLHTMSVVQRLTVEGLYNQTHLIAGRGIDNLSLLQPVVSGDVISAQMEIRRLKAYPRLQRGLVSAHCRAHNQDGALLMKMDVEFLVTSHSGQQR